MTKIDFDLKDTEPFGEMEALPDGEYDVVITEASFGRPTPDKKERVNITYAITDGKFAGRNIWDNFFINDDKEQVKNIARSKVKSLSEACKIMPSNYEDFIGKVLTVKVKRTSANDQTYINVTKYMAKVDKSVPFKL